MKKAGILLPIFSLPSLRGVRTFGKEAYAFIDLIKESGLTYWQILPLNPLDRSYSPYQTISSFAGETIYIDLDGLVEMGLLDKIEEETFDPYWVDYHRIKMTKEDYFKEAFKRFDKNHPDYNDFEAFIAHTSWLDDYCRFKVLYHLNGKTDWPTWQDATIDEQHVQFEAFKQYLFFKQWNKLKDYANHAGIKIIGDLPFYIGFNSEDVYNHRSLFKLDENSQPSCVSGVPPDYFNPDGQRWNHPIYDWEMMEKEHFTYWIGKIKQACAMVDILRLDHFRAFDTFWQVNARSEGAKDGQWIEAPGKALFTELFKQEPNLNIIVEDLGYLREEVYALKDMFHFSGMKIMQFSFEETLANTIPENCLFYTGTHDNDTLMGWKAKDNISYTLEELLDMALHTNANTVIIPLQDFLGLDDTNRINSPGTEGPHNWTWRIDSFEQLKNKIPEIKEMLIKSKRI